MDTRETHIRETVAGTLLDLITKGYTFDEVSAALLKTEWPPLIEACRLEREARIAAQRAEWEAERQARLEELENTIVKCMRCSALARRRDLISLEDVPGHRFQSVCASCAERIKGQRERTCAICGSLYYNHRINGSYPFCPSCATPERIREDERVRGQNWRTSQEGLVSDLTVMQWLATLEHFQRMCAYCQTVPFTDLEHFIPVSEGGGTTWTNCVPACKNCNQRKRYDGLPQETLERVGAYLLSLSQAA